MPSSRDRISNSRPRPARNSIMTRRNFSPTATAGSARLRNQSNSTRRTGEVKGMIAGYISTSFRGARSANPESRDSGSGPSDHPGMTSQNFHHDSKIKENSFSRRRNPHQGPGQGRAEAAGAGDRASRQALLSGRRAEDFRRRLRRAAPALQ